MIAGKEFVQDYLVIPLLLSLGLSVFISAFMIFIGYNINTVQFEDVISIYLFVFIRCAAVLFVISWITHAVKSRRR